MYLARIKFGGSATNHDLWVKLYNLSRVFKTDISAVLTVKSGLDPHRLEFQLQGVWLMVIMVMMMDMVMVHVYLFNMFTVFIIKGWVLLIIASN